MIESSFRAVVLEALSVLVGGLKNEGHLVSPGIELPKGNASSLEPQQTTPLRARAPVKDIVRKIRAEG